VLVPRPLFPSLSHRLHPDLESILKTIRTLRVQHLDSETNCFDMASLRPALILALAANVMGASDNMGPAAFFWPPDRAWSERADNTAPCGSVAGVGNRTEFPLSEKFPRWIRHIVTDPWLRKAVVKLRLPPRTIPTTHG
jgi:hypothetical protein